MLLKTPIDAQLLARLEALLHVESLEELVGPPHALLRPTTCAVSGKRLAERGHMIEGLGYVSTEIAALLLIRGLVEHIHDLERVKTLQNEFAARTKVTRPNPLRPSEPLDPALVQNMLREVKGVAPTPDGSELVLRPRDEQDRAKFVQDELAARAKKVRINGIAEAMNEAPVPQPGPWPQEMPEPQSRIVELMPGGTIDAEGKLTIDEVSLVDPFTVGRGVQPLTVGADVQPLTLGPIIKHESIPQDSIALVTDMSIIPEGVSVISKIGGGTESGIPIGEGQMNEETALAEAQRRWGGGAKVAFKDGVYSVGSGRMDGLFGSSSNSWEAAFADTKSRDPQYDQHMGIVRREQQRIKRGVDGPGWTWTRKKDGVSLTGEVVIAKGAKVDIRSLPQGTVVRFAAVDGPVQLKEDPRVRPADGSPVCAEDAALVRTQWDIDHGIVAPPAVARKWAGAHIVDRPEVDLSRLPESDREVFEGYRPGQYIFENASDVYRYEREVGGAEIAEAVEASFRATDEEEYGKVITDADVQREKGRTRGEDGIFTVKFPKGIEPPSH